MTRRSDISRSSSLLILWDRDQEADQHIILYIFAEIYQNVTFPQILGMLGDVASNNTQCVWLTLEESEDGNVSLSYSSMDCLARQAFVCEVRVILLSQYYYIYTYIITSYHYYIITIYNQVRVYTQTWYYWATANWLQILFCLTLVLLIISSCVTVSVIFLKIFCSILISELTIDLMLILQMYSSSPRSRRSRGSTDLSSSPPPYTPRDTNTTSLKVQDLLIYL